MKTAKEWAAEVVTVQRRDEPRNGTTYIIALEHGEDVHVFDDVDLAEDTAKDGHAHYSGIIERLVERVQSDARAPLEEEIAQRDAYIRGLRREENEWRKVACGRGRVLGDVADALEELRGVAAPGSTAEAICERLMPKIEEALR